MKLGFVSDSLAHLKFDAALDVAVELGLQPQMAVERGSAALLGQACTADQGERRQALRPELHGGQLVYNVPSLLKLRQAIGPMFGANLDPSHLFWMGADPLAAADALKGAVHHVHAKDTMLNAPVQATTSLSENGGLTDIVAARLRPRRAMVGRLLLSSPDGGLRRLAVDRA